MNLNASLDQIFTILDEDDPLKHVATLRKILTKIKRGIRQSKLDDEILDMLQEYLEAWLVEGAIEEDIDSFAEETGDIYEKCAEDDDDDEEEEEDY